MTKPRPERLAIWMYGRHVATLTKARGRLGLAYTVAALDAFDVNVALLFVGLPVGPQAFPDARVRPFFEGLLRTWARGTASLERLLDTTFLNVAVGNADAHAKNLSLLHDEAGGGARRAHRAGAGPGRGPRGRPRGMIRATWALPAQ